MTTCKGTYNVNGRCESVDVCEDIASSFGELLRGSVRANERVLIGSRVHGLQNNSIDLDVGDTGLTVVGNQNIILQEYPVVRNGQGGCESDRRQSLTVCTLPCAIFMECKYANPLAAPLI